MAFKWNSFLSTIKNNGNWIFVKRTLTMLESTHFTFPMVPKATVKLSSYKLLCQHFEVLDFKRKSWKFWHFSKNAAKFKNYTMLMAEKPSWICQWHKSHFEWTLFYVILIREIPGVYKSFCLSVFSFVCVLWGTSH